MSNTSSTTVIIAVPGGQETQELSLESAKAAFARGEIEPTRWAWCRTHKNWKPIAELPEFQFVPTPAQAPIQPTGFAPAATVAKAEPVVASANPVAKVKATAAAVTPAVQARPVVQTVRRVKSGKELVVKEESTFSYFKLFVIGLGLAVAGIVGANYLLVDQPLTTNLQNTSFASTAVHAHLGAFFQPDTIIIHTPASSTVTATNLADFLIALAKSTPTQPINHLPFATVGLTTAWSSQFLMSGDDWQALAKMTSASDEEKKDFILTRIGYPDGHRLLATDKNLGPDAVTARRDAAWTTLASVLAQ